MKDKIIMQVWVITQTTYDDDAMPMTEVLAVAESEMLARRIAEAHWNKLFNLPVNRASNLIWSGLEARFSFGEYLVKEVEFADHYCEVQV